MQVFDDSRGTEVNQFAYIRFILQAVFGNDPLLWIVQNFMKQEETLLGKKLNYLMPIKGNRISKW